MSRENRDQGYFILLLHAYARQMLTDTSLNERLRLTLKMCKNQRYLFSKIISMVSKVFYFSDIKTIHLIFCSLACQKIDLKSDCFTLFPSPLPHQSFWCFVSKTNVRTFSKIIISIFSLTLSKTTKCVIQKSVI